MNFGAGVPTVEVPDLKDGDFLLDVREDDEWQAGHAAGALHIPMSEFVARYGELTEAAPQDGRVHVICRSGGRSAQVTMYLLQQGLDAVNVDGRHEGLAGRGAPRRHRAGAAGPGHLSRCRCHCRVRPLPRYAR
ncbi:rhodanese-related sulfurtransferase [Streptomyces sp. V3I7]|nr:rhodanese-related sulfurtransferase [Streptomyces sp. V3I7]